MGNCFNFQNLNNLFIGGLFSILHAAILFMTIMIILVTDNLFILYSMGIIELIILFLNYKFGDCPISIIEEEYTGSSFIDLVNNFTPVNRNSIHKNLRSEITLHWIFMLLILVLFKILIIFSKMIFSKTKLSENIQIIIK
jgi:hypothetical protein